MTQEDLFDRRLASWLGDGPTAAPERAIDIAVDHAYRHARRRGPLQRLRRAIMSTVPLTPIASPAHRTWLTAAVAIAVVAIAGLALAGSQRSLDRGSGTTPASPGSSSSIAPSADTARPSAPPSIAPIYPPGTAYNVAGDNDPDNGMSCAPTYCYFASTVTASDDRLTGRMVIEASGGTEDGTFGTVGFFERTTVGVGYFRISQLPADEMTWEGEWFTTGVRPHGIPEAMDPSVIWPIDTMWLHGKGPNEGLTALLRMTSVGMEGWIFPTPTSH